ncbi:hypothetical protein ACLB2K_035609 [Fragaria x ananassa]
MGLRSLLHSVVFLWIIASFSFGNGYGQNGTLSVLDFGAHGDGVADDTQAFINAWNKLCSTSQLLKIPAGKTFVVKPFELLGPCKFSSVILQIDGNIVAPSTLKGWGDVCKLGCWLCFRNVKGLIIKGGGLINGKENSPNTDGIDISLSSQVTIQDSVIRTGDDCVAIKGGSSFVNVTHVTCGPGHGFSLGSLGQDPTTEDKVEHIYFQNCNCERTMYCARIKTYMGGVGYAREIFFRGMTLVQSRNPILIDQHYVAVAANFPAKNGGVKVSEVEFIGFTGTSSSEEAITLDCSDLGCSNILMDHVILTSATGKPLRSVCRKATGRATFTKPLVPCLSGKQSLSPTIAPISVDMH